MYWTEKMCIPVALLFLALLVPSQAQTGSPQVSVTPAEADLSGELREFLYDVRANLVLRCELPNDAGLPYVWTKNATKLEEVWEMKDRYQLEKGGAELKVGRALEDDFGNYTCALAGQAQTQGWAAANFSALAGRGEVTDSEQGVPDGTLVMEAAARTDAGLTCTRRCGLSSESARRCSFCAPSSWCMRRDVPSPTSTTPTLTTTTRRSRKM
ncbi:unnamed protein product [Leptidea sinapis]|uniref:Ig-like domain-containing protein n=1 Tax=Leptidea sinapis TaxID=189913 RepID=A0A5E4QMY0_9NEOP|nr:unnamed protein product [Leptidea sinapis]